MKLEALFNAVIVKPIELEETMFGNIIVPDLGSERNKTAEIVSIGPGFESGYVKFMKTNLQVNDIVVLPSLGFTKFEYDGEEYWIGKENDILAKINK
jgi:co-chaperonin GroES (HSP10)